MTIQQIYNSYYKHIPLDVFNAAVAADPTSYNQGEVVKVGNFVKWILKLYQNSTWKEGDSYETWDLLSKFIKYKSKLPLEKRDINRYDSVHDIYSLIQSLEGQGVKSQKDVKREGAEVVYEDSEWKIVIPHTEEASCIYGAHTKWCTAGREHNMFDYYNKQGHLYININKQTGDKYQFHFETTSFMDAEDKKISPRKIGLSEGAVGYYKSIGKEPYIIYDYVGRFSNGFAKVKLEDRVWNFINEQGELLWGKDKWFVNVYSFYNGSAAVKLEGKGWNFINTKGELVWKGDKWFYTVGKFSEGVARVYIKGQGFNFINPNGELLWKEYKNFDKVYDFSEGFAGVKIEGKGYNFINTNCGLLWKEDIWFDGVGDFLKGFACVKIEGQGFNFINSQGELLWKEDKWFDSVEKIYNGFACVKIEGKGYNFINSQGEFLWKEYKNYDYVGYFHNGFVEVKIKDKGCNFINTQGELLWKEDNWFDLVYYFSKGFAIVYKEDKGWNFINTNGELLWKEDKWFDHVGHFLNGFVEVKYKGVWYKLNTKGELIEN